MGIFSSGKASDSSSDANASSNSTTYAKAKYFEDQFDDEEVLFVFRKHPIVMRKGLILSSFGLLIGPLVILAWTFLKPDNPPTMNMFFLSLLGSFALAALIFTPSWIAWNFSVYIVTDQRLIQIQQRGFFSRSVVDMALRQIQMVNYEINGLNETLLGFGTIMMQTLVGDLVIHEVHHPAKTAKRIQIILREHGINATSYQISPDQQDYDAQDAQASNQEITQED